MDLESNESKARWQGHANRGGASAQGGLELKVSLVDTTLADRSEGDGDREESLRGATSGEGPAEVDGIHRYLLATAPTLPVPAGRSLQLELVVRRVTVGEYSVSGLAALYAMSFAAVQKHVAVLERASLVSKEKRGREQIVRGDHEGLLKARRLLDEYEQIWRQRAARMADILTEG